MKQKFLPIFALVFLAAALAAQPAVKKDSVSAQAKTTAAAPAPAQPKTSDEELILDDSDKPAPQPGETTAAAPASDTAKKAAAIKAAAGADTASAKKATTEKTVAAPKAAHPQVPARDTAQKISDEELILDGGAEDLLGQTKGAAKKTAAPAATDSSAAGAAATSADSAAASVPAPADSAAQAADSGAQSPAAVASAPAAPAAPVEAEKIEKVRSINFAANLKEYRSPKLAMLMSLIIPGSGQFYAKSSLTAAACLAVEAALIGTGYAFVKKGQSEKKKARTYADSLYSADKFSNYDKDLRTFLGAKFGPASGDSIYYGIIHFGDSSAAENFLKDANAKNDNYYDAIEDASGTFVRGWDDVAPGFSADNAIEITDADTAMYGAFTNDSAYFAYKKEPGKYPAYGFSQHQITYSDMVSKAQGLSRIGSRFYMSLLVNHLASAVIAGILAKKHNDELLGKESFWRRIDVEEQMVNTGTTVVSGYALAVRF